MIIFSAIIPYSPLLIPQIGKNNLERLNNTANAYKKLAEQLNESKADTILIISLDKIVYDNFFTINLNTEYKCDFNEFGNFSINHNWLCNLGLTQNIRLKFETSSKLKLTTIDNLNYTFSVPLCLLTKINQENNNIKIIPLNISGLSNKEHYNFGKSIQNILKSRDERIAIIASGNLSHSLEKDSPAKFSSKAKKFDNKIIEFLSNKKIDNILNLDENLIKEVNESALKQILILLGALEDTNYNPKLLSYESPFGVGYMTMKM